MSDTLTQLVTSFYNAIINDIASLPSTYSLFPLACCQDTSWILKRYLEENGQSDIVLVGGQHHAWLEQNGLIIDLTLKQFEDKFGHPIDAIIITTDRTLYKQFKVTYRYSKSYDDQYANQYTDHVVNDLNRYYNIVTSNIEN